jgi:hypothetical protein
MRRLHSDTDIDVEDGFVYWLERDFHAWDGLGRVVRAPVDGGAHEVVADCVLMPMVLFVHDGVIDVGGEGVDWSGMNATELLRFAIP